MMMQQDEANIVAGEMPMPPPHDPVARKEPLSGDPFLSALLIVFPVAMCGLVLATWFLFGRQRISGWLALAAMAAIAAVYYGLFGRGRRPGA